MTRLATFRVEWRSRLRRNPGYPGAALLGIILGGYSPGRLIAHPDDCLATLCFEDKPKTLPDFAGAKGQEERMKSPGASRLRPVDPVGKSMAEDGEGFRRCIRNRAQSLLPGKRQIPRTEEDRHQVVIGIQVRYIGQATGLFERPPKLSGEKVECKMFDRKITD
jgi:hypothetical protein